MNDTVKFDELVQITSRLITLLNNEVDYLRAMNVSAIDGLQEEKRQLTAHYEDLIRRLAEQPDVLAALEPAMQEELGRLSKELDDAVSENTRALNAVRDSHERLLSAIVDAVSKDRNRHASYTASGTGPARSARSAEALSLTIDQQL